MRSAYLFKDKFQHFFPLHLQLSAVGKKIYELCDMKKFFSHIIIFCSFTALALGFTNIFFSHNFYIFCCDEAREKK